MGAFEGIIRARQEGMIKALVLYLIAERKTTLTKKQKQLMIQCALLV
jgi:hypothetical protein